MENTKNKEGLLVTNAIANAGMRVRWNIWNLYIHLCWQTVEQQFNPALAIASAVSNKAKSAAHLSTFGFCPSTSQKLKNQKNLNF